LDGILHLLKLLPNNKSIKAKRELRDYDSKTKKTTEAVFVKELDINTSD